MGTCANLGGKQEDGAALFRELQADVIAYIKRLNSGKGKVVQGNENLFYMMIIIFILV